MKLFAAKNAAVLSLVLAGQLAAYYMLPKAEYVPEAKPLRQMPAQFADWHLTSETEPEKEIQELLRADDALTRIYTNPAGYQISMFVAFFKTQRAGVQPHSPRVCLPASGWTPEHDSYVNIAIPGRSEPIAVNRYVVGRGEARSVVYYWYQTPHRVVASEFAAKGYLVWDSLRYHRSDTSLVRVISAAPSSAEVPAADQRALEFIKLSFDPVRNHLPL